VHARGPQALEISSNARCRLQKEQAGLPSDAGAAAADRSVPDWSTCPISSGRSLADQPHSEGTSYHSGSGAPCDTAKGSAYGSRTQKNKSRVSRHAALEARPGLPVFHLVVEFSLSHGAFSTAAQAVEETLSIRPQKTDHLLRREALAGLATVTAHTPCVPRVHRSTGSLREVEGLTFAPTVWWWCLRPAPPTRWPRAGAGRLGARLGTTPQIAGRPQRCGGASQLRKQGGATRHSWEGGGVAAAAPSRVSVRGIPAPASTEAPRHPIRVEGGTS